MSNRMNVYELLYMARCADDEAFKALIEQFKPLFYKTYKELKAKYERVDYDDVYDAMITGLYNAVTHYREDRKTAFTSFATLCITREMRSYYKKNSIKTKGVKTIQLESYMQDVENLRYSDAVLRDDTNSPESRLRLKLLIEEINEVLGDTIERRVFHLRVEGYSYTEIAEILGIKKKDVDNSLQRIRKKIAYLFD